MSRYTYEQYLADQETADSLDFAENCLHAPHEIAERVCNGIGAKWFPAGIRKAVSGLNPSLVVVAQNHDLGYYYGTGTASDFIRKNEAFRINGEKVAKAKYKWYDPRRYWVMLQAAKFAALCNVGGWPAYVVAINERKADEAEKAMQAVEEAKAYV